MKQLIAGGVQIAALPGCNKSSLMFGWILGHNLFTCTILQFYLYVEGLLTAFIVHCPSHQGSNFFAVGIESHTLSPALNSQVVVPLS